jgi:DNA-binding transcriptional LysR family regulator
MKNKYGIDFNLSKHLEALLLHRSVSKAAQQVGITQPAMSNSFIKIKAHFKDPILVKTKSGYILTPLAESLLPKMQILMKEFDAVFLERKAFDATIDKSVFNIIVSDASGFVIGPKLLNHIEEKFPNIRINLLPMEDNFSLNKLDNDQVSLAIVSTLDSKLPERLYTKLIRKEPFSVAGCGTHLENKKSISFKDYVNGSHYIVTPKGIDSTVIDKELEKLGHTRKVTNNISHFSIAVNAVLDTPHFLTLPSSVLEQSAKYIPIKVFQIPFELPQVNHSLLWHERVHTDEGNIWLRNLISDLVKFLPGMY